MDGYKYIFDEAQINYSKNEDTLHLEKFRYMRHMYGFCINEGDVDNQALGYAKEINSELCDRFMSQPKGLTGYKHNEDTKNRMSKTHKERETNKGSNNNMYGKVGPLNHMFGKKRPDLSERNKSLEKRLATSLSLKGKPKSESHKQAMRDAKRRKKESL